MERERVKKRWEEPKMLLVDSLPEALGHCVTGPTPIDTGSSQGCYNGTDTAGGAPNSHNCGTGGAVGGTTCNTGSAVLV